MSKEIEQVLRSKTIEQLNYIKMFKMDMDKDSRDMAVSFGVVKNIKNKKADATIEDVQEELTEYIYRAGIFEMKNQQVMNRHLVLFREYETLCKSLDIDLNLTKEDEDFVKNLSSSPIMLYIPTESGIEPFDKEQYNILMEKHREKCKDKNLLQTYFDYIK